MRILVERLEDAPSDARVTLAGRFLPEQLHEVAHLLDGQILDTSALAITADEIVDALSRARPAVADQVVQAADGSVKLVVTALDQWRRQPDPGPRGHRRPRLAQRQRGRPASNSTPPIASSSGCSPARRVSTSRCSPRSAGPASCGGRWRPASRCAGRSPATSTCSMRPFYRAHEIEAATATRLASALAERGRPLEAAGLLLDAGVPDRAARLLMDAARVGHQVGRAASDAQRARPPRHGHRQRTGAAAPAGQRRRPRSVASIRSSTTSIGPPPSPRTPIRRSVGGSRPPSPEPSSSAATATRRSPSPRSGLRDIGPGEEHTFARAHEVLALATAASETRDDLQLAAESFRVAAAAWDACGESALARNCRCDLAMAVLIPLGRFDEALAVLAQVLAVAGLNDAERSWLMTYEGFALLEANRLAAATGRFERVADLGYLQDNSTIVATAAWGRAMIAAREDDLADGPAVDRDGGEHRPRRHRRPARRVVPVRCQPRCSAPSASSASPSATCHRAEARPKLYDHDVRRARFVFEARSGVVGDVDEQLSVTRPAEWWRVLLVAALGHARTGNLDHARELLRIRRSASSSGSASGASTRSVSGEPPTSCSSCCMPTAEPAVSQSTGPRQRLSGLDLVDQPTTTAGRRVRVIGGPMVIEDDTGVVEVPSGNPQRLVGVVVANGGVATFDQLAEAMWPGDDVETSRARLRNVLLRLRRGVGDVVIRFGSGVRLAPDVALRPARVRAPGDRRPVVGAQRSGARRTARRPGRGPRRRRRARRLRVRGVGVGVATFGRPAADRPARPAVGAGRGRRRPAPGTGARRARRCGSTATRTRATSGSPSC